MRGLRDRGSRPEFIIWTAGWNEAVGGTIVLHTLCNRLNESGVRAALWPDYKPVAGRFGPLETIVRRLLYHVRGERRFGRGPFNNAIAPARALSMAIVVYPESVVGNPLGAERVVRWLLNKPGTFSGGRTGYSADDLYFYFQAAFDDPTLNPDCDAQLMLIWVNPIYRDLGLPGRAGSCYMLRKGAGRPIVHPPDSIPIDELSDAQKVCVLNATERFYCYDLYTFYTNYAALCGCIPIVVPDPAVPKEQWIVRPEDRYGVAYGVEDVPWAVETRDDMLRTLDERRAREDVMLRAFVAKCRARFG